MSILKATHRESGCSVVGAHEGIAAEELEVARIVTANRTAPIEAARPDTEERTIAEVAVTRQRQF